MYFINNFEMIFQFIIKNIENILCIEYNCIFVKINNHDESNIENLFIFFLVLQHKHDPFEQIDPFQKDLSFYHDHFILFRFPIEQEKQN